MDTVTVRKEFSSLKDFARELPRIFDREGEVIHNGRNVIKKIRRDGSTLVVKNFAGMYFFNRLAYSLFRKSKAERSYQYSAVLNEKGIKTPPHVGWVDCYSGGLLTRSYFVSVYYPYRTLDEMIKYYEVFHPPFKAGLIKHLAGFVHKLHSKGIYHEDLSPGNILVIRTLKGFDFALVDLNRIKFHPISHAAALKNFSTLVLPPDDTDMLIREYCKYNGQDADKAIAFLHTYQKRKTMLRGIRRSIRKYTLSPIERLLSKRHSKD